MQKLRLSALWAPLLVVSLFLLAGCSRLDLLTVNETPEAWLSSHPHITLQLGGTDFVLAEPSSSAIVYGLALAIFLAAAAFARRAKPSRSRSWWIAALIVWGISTVSAGTNYQAFNYMLHYAGRSVGLASSWWEIWYLILFVGAMNLIVVAVAQSSAAGLGRRLLVGYAAANSAAYLAFVLIGAFLPDRFLASFEGMLLFAGPTFIVLLATNLVAWLRSRRPLDFRLMLSWLLMFGVMVAYFAWYLSGLSGWLWERGVWFNANDVLHVGLIAWLVWLVRCVMPLVVDAD